MSTTAKEVPKESPLKDRKRRRAIKPDKADVQSTPEPRKVRGISESAADRAKQVKSVFYYEENEVEKRDPKTDLSLHKMSSNELRKVMADIIELKNGDEEDKAEKLEELRIHGTLQFVTLRKLNRMAHFRCKKARDNTNDAKQKIDQQNLRLQNLLYEVMHLQKEITKCLEFKSKDEEISLVPVDDFYKEAPPAISRSDVTKTDNHQQTLARLEFELEQRKRLSEQLNEAEGHKEVISNETKTKREYLNSLQPKLNSILQSTKPVQEYLEMPFDEIREQQMTAMYLPQPLYVLYMQSSAYNDACDQYLTVSIQGDLDVAKAMEGTSVDIDEDSDSENEDQEKPREKRRRRATADDQVSEKKQKILKKHPLSIQICIKCKDGSTLQLTFHYLVALKIITVAVKLSPGPNTGTMSISGSELLSPDSLLNCLYPDDTGNDTPNMSNNFALKRLGLGEFSQYIKDVGRPYHWCQWLCGLQFLNISDKAPRVQVSVSCGHMEGTIKRLRHRIKARLSLQKQLAALERGQVTVSKEYHSLFPAKITARLASWKRSTYEDFVALRYTQSVVANDLAPTAGMYYVGVAERGSAKMTMQIIVSHDYPEVAPLFVLLINWKKDLSSGNDENIRTMEAEVNIHYTELTKDKSHDQLLTNQINRLLMCFDVYLEGEPEGSRQEGPVEFAREKIFPRLARGPNRTKPFKFNSQLGFFSQT